jgi:hypothetical protein
MAESSSDDAVKKLQNFLKENNIVLKLSSQKIDTKTDGTLIISLPNIIVEYGKSNSPKR